MFEKLCAIIVDQFGLEPGSVDADTSFVDDLGADSVDLVELSMALEEEFGLGEMEEEDIASIATVGDLYKYMQDHLDICTQTEREKAPFQRGFLFGGDHEKAGGKIGIHLSEPGAAAPRHDSQLLCQ